MTVTRGDIEAEARRWVGTPFRHQGRTERGVDCGGLIIAVAHQLGLPFEDWRAYGRQPDGHSLEAILGRVASPTAVPQRGDILLFRITTLPQHLALAVERRGQLYMVHSYSQAARVAENRVDESWRTRLVRAYTGKGIDDG